MAAFCQALTSIGHDVRVLDYVEHALSAGGRRPGEVAYLECAIDAVRSFGVGIDSSITTAFAKAGWRKLNWSAAWPRAAPTCDGLTPVELTAARLARAPGRRESRTTAAVRSSAGPLLGQGVDLIAGVADLRRSGPLVRQHHQAGADRADGCCRGQVGRRQAGQPVHPPGPARQQRSHAASPAHVGRAGVSRRTRLGIGGTASTRTPRRAASVSWSSARTSRKYWVMSATVAGTIASAIPISRAARTCSRRYSSASRSKE